MTWEQFLIQLFLQLSQMIVSPQSLQTASQTLQLVNQKAAQARDMQDWKIYILTTLLLLLLVWMSQRIRSLTESFEQKLKEQKNEFEHHYQNCDKVSKKEISDYLAYKISLAKVLMVLGKEFKGKYGVYLNNAMFDIKDDFPGDS